MPQPKERRTPEQNPALPAHAQPLPDDEFDDDDDDPEWEYDDAA